MVHVATQVPPGLSTPSRAKTAVRLSGNGPRVGNAAMPYLLLAPVGLFLCVFSLFPFVWALLISLQPAMRGSTASITGFTTANFADVLSDPRTYASIWTTLLYAVLSTFLCIVFSIATALAIKTVRRGSAVYQTFLLIPLTLAPPVVIILWRALFAPKTGAVNGVLERFGVSAQGFYESPNQALLVLVAMAVWTNVGFWTLLFLSALNTINSEVWEAAAIDGAGPLSTFFRITLPLLKRTVLLAGVVLMTAGLVVFIPAQLLTQGGPADATNFLMYMAAQDVLRYGQPGSANAIVVLILLLIALVAAIQFRLLRSDDA